MSHRKYIKFLKNLRKRQCAIIDENNSQCKYCPFYLYNKFSFAYKNENKRTNYCCIDAMIDELMVDEKASYECYYCNYVSKYNKFIRDILKRIHPNNKIEEIILSIHNFKHHKDESMCNISTIIKHCFEEFGMIFIDFFIMILNIIMCGLYIFLFPFGKLFEFIKREFF